jgi:hypothetical protein
MLENDTNDDDDDELTQLFQAWMLRRTPGSRMNKETWTSLAPATQTAWDTIPDKDKAAILGYATQRAEKHSPDPITRQTNVHATETELDPDESEEDTSNPDIQANLTKSIQEVNATKGKAHPGDGRVEKNYTLASVYNPRRG